jgi:hypothetical protein
MALIDARAALQLIEDYGVTRRDNVPRSCLRQRYTLQPQA